MTHLTDTEIQEYLDACRNGWKSPYTEHLKACNDCQQQVELYTALYTHMEQEEVNFEIPDDFTDSVLNEWSRLELAKKRNSVMLYGISIFTFISGSILASYYELVSFGKFLNSFEEIFFILKDAWISTVLRPVHSLFKNSFSLLLISCFVFLLTLALDKWVFQPKFPIRQT